MSDLNIVDGKHQLICCHLRSKGMYVYDTLEETEEGGDVPGSGDGNFWCIKTMHLFGPDNEEASREACRPGRNCFQKI